MTMKITQKKTLLSRSLLAASMIPVGMALGTPLAQAQESRADSRLEEVVVTARKRTESLQDVPVAVSALSAGQIERSGIMSVLDVSKMVPNVELHQVTQSGAALGASIRGMAFDDLEKSFEPTVGISVDGVFMASNSGAVVDFFDIEAVEVLRGPQGTLFGRNTIAGVINIKRSQPTGEWGAKLEGTFGDFDRQELKAIVNAPLGDKGGVKGYYIDLEQDSHLYNTFNNERPYNRDSELWGGAISYQFTDEFSATIAYDDYDHNTQPPDVLATGTADNVFCGLYKNIGLPFSGACNEFSGQLSKDNGYTTSNAKDQIYSYLWGDNLTINAQYEADKYTVKYIYGNMDFSEEAFFSSWGAPQTLFPVLREQDYEQTSHELQYLSNYDGPLNIVAGLYYLETDSYLTSGPGSNFTTTQEAEAQAVFGELNYEINELWSMTLGARYTKEDKELFSRGYANNADRRNDVNPTRELTPDYDDDNVSYRFVLQRNFDFGMAYASYSTGYRSGGFNSRGSNDDTIGPYGSEEVASIELGLRTQPTDATQLNITGFFSEYDDKQQFVVTDGTQCGLAATQTCTFVRNIAQTNNDGLEIEAIWMPTDALTLRAAYGYLDASYDSYDFNGVDISDRAQVIYAPENTYTLVAEHTSNLFGGTLVLSGTYSYKDEVWGAAEYAFYNYDTGPEIKIDDHHQLDLSATYLYDLSTGTIKLVAFGTDVLDEDGRVSRAFDAGAFAWQELVPGRQLGVKIGYEF